MIGAVHYKLRATNSARLPLINGRLMHAAFFKILHNIAPEIENFVHENMKADRLFEQMKKSGSDHFAVVVDEYGGMSGIITVTDLVEQLVGEFSDDEDDEPQLRIEKTGENTWFIPGSASIAEVSDELDVTLPADKYDTFGGYVIDELGDVPRDGTQITLEADGLRIEVIEISHHRIEACRVEKIVPEQPDSGESTD